MTTTFQRLQRYIHTRTHPTCTFVLNHCPILETDLKRLKTMGSCLDRCCMTNIIAFFKKTATHTHVVVDNYGLGLAGFCLCLVWHIPVGHVTEPDLLHTVRDF